MRKLVIALAVIIAASTSPLIGQTSPLLLPPAVEKALAARASDVTEVTLNKSMLGFAAKFMDGKDKDQAAAQQLIQGLDGIYVRDYEFDKEGEYSMDDVEHVRQQFETSEWSPIVRERERGEVTDVMVKLVNGEPHGMFILSAERKELSIVLILGPIRMEDLSRLNGIGGLGALGSLAGVPPPPHGKVAGKEDKGKTKDGDKSKTKDKKDGAQ
jgi:Domain of unknown function (DUF4252)